MLAGRGVLSGTLVVAGHVAALFWPLFWTAVGPAQGVRKLVAAPPEVLGVGWSEAG